MTQERSDDGRAGRAVWDRDAVRAAVDLPALANELLGPYAGTERSPSWPCPNPDHLQTGRTPPVTVYMGRAGDQRWHCHGCGNRGTAIDLLMQVCGVDVRSAVAELIRRAGRPVQELACPPGLDRRRRARSRASSSPASAVPPRYVPALDDYVAQCAEALWRPEADAIRRWLTDARGLPEDVLRLNRVGADLGSARQQRPDGVPRVRRAVVLPVLVDGGACYVQLRVLGASRRFPKYLNPSDALAPNPRLGVYQPAQHFATPFERDALIVTEGIIDALSAAAGGYQSAAVLSATYADPIAAVALTRHPGQLVVAFDPDPAGRAGAERLVQLLDTRHRRAGVMVLQHGDLNDHLRRAHDWPLEVAARVQHATHRPGSLPRRGVVPAVGR